jgi:tRNA-2-methylthio-N6-dimethylallyladenosine synthase
MVARLSQLQDRLGGQQKDFNCASVGRTMEVLFERRGTRPGQLVGRSPYLQSVQVEAPDSLLGTLAEVSIVATGTWSLHGELPQIRAREDVA